MEVQTTSRLIEVAAVDQPWRLQSQRRLKQLLLAHPPAILTQRARRRTTRKFLKMGLRPKPQDLPLSARVELELPIKEQRS